MKAVYRLRLTAFLTTARLTAFLTTARLTAFLTTARFTVDLLRVAAALFAALLRFRLVAILAASTANFAKFLFLVRAAFLAASTLLALDIPMPSLLLSLRLYG